MPAIGFPTETTVPDNAQEGAGRLINCYAEPLPEGAGGDFVRRRAPGLSLFANTELTGFRGMIYVPPYGLFAAYAETLVLVSSAGAVTTIDTLEGTEPVFAARNNKSPVPDIVFVTENGAFVATTSTVTDLGDPDLPQPNSVCFLDGYFFFSIADGRIFASGLNATTINGLDYTTAQARAGGLLRVVPFGRQLFACGPTFMEVYSNTAEPTGFPFTRAAVVDRGLAGARAIAGWEDGFTKALVWVADDNSVCTLDGYTPVKVSTPDLERLIAAVADKSTLEASVYIVDGRPCWVLSCAAWTWVLDLDAKKWHERKSHYYDRWRATGGVQAFGKWITADIADGSLFEVTAAKQTDNGWPIRVVAESIQMAAFPRPYRVGEVYFDLVVGTARAAGAEPIETEPQCWISWSDDGGYSFSTPVVRPLGRQAKGRTRVTVNRTGRTSLRGRRWRVEVSDPVYVGLLGGNMDVLEGKS